MYLFFSFVFFDLVSADYTLHVSGLTFGVLRDVAFSGIWCFLTNPACLLSSRLVALSVWSKVDISPDTDNHFTSDSESEAAHCPKMTRCLHQSFDLDSGHFLTGHQSNFLGKFHHALYFPSHSQKSGRLFH
jgi:hypothetical protein